MPSPYFELLVQVINLPDELQVLGRQGPPAADEHEARQQESSDQERRTSASADSHTVDSHHSCFRIAYAGSSLTEHMPRYRRSLVSYARTRTIYVSRAFFAKREPRVTPLRDSRRATKRRRIPRRGRRRRAAFSASLRNAPFENCVF